MKQPAKRYSGDNAAAYPQMQSLQKAGIQADGLPHTGLFNLIRLSRLPLYGYICTNIPVANSRLQYYCIKVSSFIC